VTDLLRSTRSPWAATPLMAVASFVSLWALTRMISLDAWVRTTALALLGVTLIVVIARLATRSRFLPTILGALSSVWILVVLFAHNDENEGFRLPTPEALTALVRTFSAGADYASQAPAPAVVDQTLASLLTAGILALFLASEHLAVSWRAVASAGFLLILPWIPAVILSHHVSSRALVLGLAAWIGAMALSRRNAPIERGVSLGAATTATLATLALSSLAAPVALGGLGWGSIPTFDTPHPLEGSSRLNIELDLQTSLTTNSNSPVLVYVTSGSRPDAFRIYTLTDFDGVRLTSPEVEPTTRSASTGVLWPEEVSGWATSERVRLDVNVLSATERNLPIPVAPRSISVEGNWTYDAASDTVIGDNVTTRGLTYSMSVDFEFHDPAVLRASDALLEDDPGLDVSDPRFFDIAPAIDRARIQTLAEDLTKGRTGRYEKALAIQNYLRNPTNFTYDLTVEPSGGDAISSFLDSQRGYCVQFATTMVVMLRSLGIPARVGLGYLGGTYDGSNGYVVKGSDAHVWPEVYFAGHGWVRFEPTPAIQSGAPPRWADSNSSQLPVPQSVLDGGGFPSGEQPINPGDSAQDPGNTDATPIPSTPWWLFGGIGVVVAGLLAGGFVLFRRKGGVSARFLHGPEGVWQRLAARLGDLAWPPSATPGEARAHVLRGLNMVAGRPPAPVGTDALSALSGAVSDHRYAPGGTVVPQAQLESWANLVVAEAHAVTAEAKGRPSRGAVRIAPQDGL
jgi:transglutaminase-like putative cysteine protease